MVCEVSVGRIESLHKMDRRHWDHPTAPNTYRMIPIAAAPASVLIIPTLNQNSAAMDASVRTSEAKRIDCLG